jgi:hypothetical protein
MVGHWLYGVAYRTSLEARAVAYKRQVKEKELRQMANTNEKDENTWSELHSLLDCELTGLPKKYRVPIILCDLEGKTRKEAAGLLQLPEGTLSTRLARGRALLAKRMTRRGVALSSGSLAATLGQNATANLPIPLVQTTIKAGALLAAGQTLTASIISPTVIVLVKGVMKTMLLTKLKVAAAVVFAVSVIGAANLMVYRSMAADAAQTAEVQGANRLSSENQTPPPDQGKSLSSDRDQDEKVKQAKDNEGQPLRPAGEGAKDSKTNDLPQRPLPYWASVSIDQEGKFVVEVPQVTYETKYAKTEKDGEEIEVYYYEPNVNEFIHRFEPSEVIAFSVQGKAIDAKDLQRLLTKKTIVLTSTDGRKVPAYYLKIMKEDALALVFSNKLVSPYGPPAAEPALPSGVKFAKSSGPPKGPAPYWVRVSIGKEGKFIVRVPNVTYKAGTAKIKKNGEEIEAYFYDPVATENVKQFESKDVQLFTVGGKAIDSKEAEILLADGKTLALASTDARKVDPYYLKIFKEDTLVLVISKPLFDSSATYRVPPYLGPPPP